MAGRKNWQGLIWLVHGFFGIIATGFADGAVHLLHGGCLKQKVTSIVNVGPFCDSPATRAGSFDAHRRGVLCGTMWSASANHRKLRQGMIEVVLVVVCLLLAGLALLLHRRALKAQARAAQLTADLEKMQQTQSQVIHTTKLASLGQMIAGVAHEMNTPIGFVKSNVEVVRELLTEHRQLVGKCMQGLDMMLSADWSKPQMIDALRRTMGKVRAALATDERLSDADDLLKDSYDGLVQIANLVKNLKGFARVDRDGMDLLDLNECVESALMIAAHQLRDRIEVIKNLGALPKIHGVASQINQVLLNLITNAGQAMNDGGTLTLMSRRAGNQVEIEVTDTGMGISDDVMPKIFDPFFTTKPVGEGTGLGLSIVHKIVQSHGGSIKVRTAPKKGSTFTISFPVDHALLKQPA